MLKLTPLLLVKQQLDAVILILAICNFCFFLCLLMKKRTVPLGDCLQNTACMSSYLKLALERCNISESYLCKTLKLNIEYK